MTELPRGPWQDIAIDSMGSLPSGDAPTDYYSRYVELTIAKGNTVEVAIKSLENIFATHGLPWTVISDNGPHFVAETFKSFLQENPIEHQKTTPLWPQANGEIIHNPKDIVFWIVFGVIERQNRSLLKRMQITRVEGEDWRIAVQTYLIAY
jgi:transposase InsO family protein